MVDSVARVVSSEMGAKLMNEINVLEEGYKRSVGECEMLLKALG